MAALPTSVLILRCFIFLVLFIQQVSTEYLKCQALFQALEYGSELDKNLCLHGADIQFIEPTRP